MPYIKPNVRPAIRSLVDQGHFVDPGSLNYAISRMVHNYIADCGVSYRTVNEAIGVLECAKLELYRTVIAPYEQQKARENGDVGVLDAENAV